MKTDIYAIVTQQIIEILEQGAGQWEHYLTESARACNVARNVEGRPYTGINAITLAFTRLRHGFKSNRWATFKQIQAKGAQVIKGSKGTPVLFFNVVEKKDAVVGEAQRYAMARYYTVFNLDQTTLVDDTPELPVEAPTNVKGCADDFVGIKIEHCLSSTACYTPALDRITMPHLPAFKSEAHYFSTLVHECSHWTGHKSRLNRDFSSRFGSYDYAMEELVAELATCFFAAATNTEFHSQRNSAAYLGLWLTKAREDSRALVTVASKAQKACELLLQHYKPAVMTGALAG